jgi:transposase
MPHRNAPNLDSAHNTAIRAEIGNRLRVLLPEEQPSPSPRIQHSLDCLSALDATEADLAIGGLSWRPLSFWFQSWGGLARYNSKSP